MNPLSTRPNRWRLVTVSNLLVGMLFSFVALAQPAFLKEGLVAYYPFNGNANDESGNGKNGQLNGVQFVNDRYGSGTSSAAFDGSKYIGLPEISPTLGQSKASFTVSLWVKPSPKIANFFISATTDNSYQFCRVGSGSDNRVNIYHRGSGQNNEAVGNIMLKPGEWNSVIYKTDGINGLGSVFINGTRDAGLDFKYDSSVNYYQPNRTWAIGTTLNTTCGGCNPYYQGGIDDVRIYNRALSDGEVKALYDYESTPPYNNFITNGLVAYYPFNGNANDESGNGNSAGSFRSASDRFGGQTAKAYETLNDAQPITVNQEGLFLKQHTFAAWVKFNGDSPAYQTIYNLVSGNAPAQASARLERIFEPASANNYSLAISRRKWTAGNPATYIDLLKHSRPNPSPVQSNGVWYHIVVVASATTSVIGNSYVYVDGSLVLTSPEYLLTGMSDSSTIRLGGDGINNYANLNGALDDVRIYNRALSDTEVKALYNYESTLPDNNFIANGLVAYYPFNGNANDESGNGRNGTVQGPISTTDRFSRKNSAYYFNGATPHNGTKPQRISTKQNSNFSNGITVACWVSADADITSENYIIGSGGNSSRWLGIRSQYGNGTEIGKRYFFSELFSSTGNQYTPSQSDVNPPILLYTPGAANWNHLVVTVGGGSMVFWVNGVLAKQISVGNLASPPLG